MNLPEKEWISYLKELVHQIGNEEGNWSHKQMRILGDCLKLLCDGNQKAKIQVLACLKEALNFPAKKGRICTVSIYHRILPALSSEEIVSSVIPSLNILSSDSEQTVRKGISNRIVFRIIFKLFRIVLKLFKIIFKL